MNTFIVVYPWGCLEGNRKKWYCLDANLFFESPTFFEESGVQKSLVGNRNCVDKIKQNKSGTCINSLRLYECPHKCWMRMCFCVYGSLPEMLNFCCFVEGYLLAYWHHTRMPLEALKLVHLTYNASIEETEPHENINWESTKTKPLNAILSFLHLYSLDQLTSWCLKGLYRLRKLCSKSFNCMAVKWPAMMSLWACD